MKKYAVELIFSEQDQKKLNDLRAVIRGKNDFTPPVNHVTLFAVTTNDLNELKQRVELFCQATKQFTLTVHSFGFFPGKGESVLFLTPVLSKELLEAKLRLEHLAAYPSFTADPHYVFGSWQPHATLALSVKDKHIGKVTDSLKSAVELPFSVKVDAVDILCCDPPYERKFIFDLAP